MLSSPDPVDIGAHVPLDKCIVEIIRPDEPLVLGARGVPYLSEAEAVHDRAVFRNPDREGCVERGIGGRRVAFVCVGWDEGEGLLCAGGLHLGEDVARVRPALGFAACDARCLRL